VNVTLAPGVTRLECPISASPRYFKGHVVPDDGLSGKPGKVATHARAYRSRYRINPTAWRRLRNSPPPAPGGRKRPRRIRKIPDSEPPPRSGADRCQ